jgi:hypothetical protein
MNLYRRLSLSNRVGFEAAALRVTLLGAFAGVLSAPLAHDFGALSPAILGGVVGVTTLFAGLLRGAAAVQSKGVRVLGALMAATCGFCLVSIPAAVVLGAAAAGFVHAGPAGTPTGRQLAGAGGAAAGAGWALWLMPQLLKLLHGLPQVPIAIGLSAAAAMLFALGLVAPHVQLDADEISARLRALAGDSGERLRKTWARCTANLVRAPSGARAELRPMLARLVTEAEQMLRSASNLDTRLKAANPADAEAQLQQLKLELGAATDSLTRERLQSAATSLSDSLEHLQTLTRKRERFGAELKLKLATLERAALSLETAQGEPEELHTLALRLTAS